MILREPPLDPGGEEARRWAEEELSKPDYDGAEPTPLDLIARAIWDFLGSLFDFNASGEWSPLFAVVVVAVMVLLVVAAIVIWGMPRLSHRTQARSAVLFGEDDDRTAAELRADAAAHAAAGEWNAAIVARFRALARGLGERDILDPVPGMTAQTLAVRAGGAFPAHGGALHSAAVIFDDVRYLRRQGSEETYAAVARTDDELRAARPAQQPEAVPL